jgi:pyridoxine kinase
MTEAVSPADAGRPLNILSIQSWVAYGHVGNASAVFPLQRLGAEVWALNTVQFSNHTGYGAWRGQVFAQRADPRPGRGNRGARRPARCDAVLSGYMGAAEIGEAILSAAARLKRRTRGALLLRPGDRRCRPRRLRPPGIPEFMRDRAVPAADIVTPNQFELEWLTGRARSLAGTTRRPRSRRCRRAAPRRAGDLAPRRRHSRRRDRAEELAARTGCFWRVRTPCAAERQRTRASDRRAVPVQPAALGEARSRSRRRVPRLRALRRTAEAGSREILTVAAQEEFVTPSRCSARAPAERGLGGAAGGRTQHLGAARVDPLEPRGPVMIRSAVSG